MLITVTAATVEPVTLAEAKAHLRVITAGDDAMIGALITAAREVVEFNTGRALAVASYRWTPEERIDRVASLPVWPVDSVSAVSYLDANEVRQTFAPADYVLDVNRSTLTLKSTVSGSALNVEFTTAAGVVPAALKAAILLMVGDMYENAEANSEKALSDNPTLQRLIFPHRINLGV